MNSPVLVLEHVRKSYAENGRVVPVLKDVTFSVERGETIAVIGASGSGKSTLLHAAGGLDGFDAGSIRLDGEELAGLNGAALDALRNRKLGFIYQFHHLLPEFTALENAAMPLLIARVPREKAFAKAKALLEKVGLGERLEHLPSELSGGERQRTAVARALAADPVCILADEPTGNLDSNSSKQVIHTLSYINQEFGKTIVMVTHDPQMASYCSRLILLKDGVILEDLKNSGNQDAFYQEILGKMKEL